MYAREAKVERYAAALDPRQDPEFEVPQSEVHRFNADSYTLKPLGGLTYPAGHGRVRAMGDVSGEFYARFWVPGVAKPQGSLAVFMPARGKRPIARHDDPKGRFATWRAMVKIKAIEAWRGQPVLVGPVGMDLCFAFEPPNKQRHWLYPITRATGDADKLLRACFDSLSGVVYADDTQVCSVQLCSVYSIEAKPGVEVQVFALDPEYEETHRKKANVA